MDSIPVNLANHQMQFFSKFTGNTVCSLWSCSLSFVLQEEPTPYEFYIDETEVQGTLEETLERLDHHDVEKVLQIVYQPQAMFKVRAVTRCSSSMPGHTEAVIAVSFSPDGRWVKLRIQSKQILKEKANQFVIILV